MQENQKTLILLLRTWTNDIGGIYDYSTKAVKVIKDNVLQSTYVVRDKNNNFENIDQHSNISKESELLFHVLNDNKDSYLLINPIPKSLKLNNENLIYLNNKIWYVIKSEDGIETENNNEDYYLSENDIIKFGKIKFAVQKIHIENNNNAGDPGMSINDLMKYDVAKLNQNCPPVFNFLFEVKHSNKLDESSILDVDETYSESSKKSKKSKHKTKNPVCYICNQETRQNDNSETDDGESNNLISLCQCEQKGLVHLECLRKNLYVKVEDRANDKSITIENFECPNCKEQYPLRYKLENEQNINYIIKEYQEPKEGDYIILESLDYFLNEKHCKSIHFIKLNNDCINIGREAENDIIEKDISISRFHAVIKYNKNNSKICLQNKSKKFGTLVLIKNPVKILDKKIHLQVGRTYIEANLEKKN